MSKYPKEPKAPRQASVVPIPRTSPRKSPSRTKVLETALESPEAQSPSTSPEQIAAHLMEGVQFPQVTQSSDPEPVPVPEPAPVVRRKATAPAPSSDGAGAIDLTTVLPLLVKALEKIATGQEDSRQAAQHALEQARRAQHPGNRETHKISIFNPQGDKDYPRPKLKCPMYLPWEADWESLTYEEIELLNLLEEGDYRVRRSDGSNMIITVRATKNIMTGKYERLLMNSETGFNQAKHRQVMPLSDMLRVMLKQNPRTKEAEKRVLTMDERTIQVENGDLPVSVVEA